MNTDLEITPPLSGYKVKIVKNVQLGNKIFAPKWIRNRNDAL